MKAISIHSAAANARLRKFAVHDPLFSAPGGDRPVAAERKIVPNLFVAEKVGERHQPMQLCDFLNHFSVCDEQVCSAIP
jgi:hypothetical protein